MAANCENLNLKLTGYDCLDVIQALKNWIEIGVTPKTEIEIKSLIDKIEYQYHNNRRSQ